MIPLPNREKLLELVKDGMDLRNASLGAKITRSNLYKYFDQFPAFRDEIDAAAKEFKEQQKTAQNKADAEGLAKIKEMILKRKR